MAAQMKSSTLDAGPLWEMETSFFDSKLTAYPGQTPLHDLAPIAR